MPNPVHWSPLVGGHRRPPRGASSAGPRSIATTSERPASRRPLLVWPKPPHRERFALTPWLAVGQDAVECLVPIGRDRVTQWSRLGAEVLLVIERELLRIEGAEDLLFRRVGAGT